MDNLADDVMSEAISLSQKLIQNSDSSMQLTKAMIHNIASFNVEEAVDYCIRLNAISRSTEDFQNGLSNFLNKK